jgi:hypothetical protein
MPEGAAHLKAEKRFSDILAHMFVFCKLEIVSIA